MRRQEHRVLLAHAAFYVGRTTTAFEIASRENVPKSSAAIRAECEAVLGLLKKRRADWSGTVGHFQSAFHWAKESRVPLLVGWSSLRLFRALAEVGPIDSLAAMLIEVRKAVTRAGDPHLSAYLHDSLALMEASAGRLEEARRHVQIAFGLVERHPNAWLNQVVLVSSFFLDFLECRYSDALNSLRAARELATVAGDGFLPVIDCNEGHLLVVMGRYEAAEQRLRKIAGSDSLSSPLGALDGLARLYLATGRLADCEHALSACDSVEMEPDTITAAFAGRRSVLTRVKLLLARTRTGRQASRRSNRWCTHGACTIGCCSANSHC